MSKSPVYGLGRNRKHRGGKTYGPLHGGAGNINMRGKKSKHMSCGCCLCFDCRDDLLKKEHYKDMKKED
jgi:hypothetical protein